MKGVKVLRKWERRTRKAGPKEGRRGWDTGPKGSGGDEHSQDYTGVQGAVLSQTLLTCVRRIIACPPRQDDHAQRTILALAIQDHPF